jgi:hypothetical protein
VTRLGADLVVEEALRHERGERRRVVSELCAGDGDLERLALDLLSHYDRPDAPIPAGPYPCELGPFTLERELGAGAHGKVYLARRRDLEGYVAVKVLRPGPGMSEFVEQVRREAGRARRIPSAHVVPVFDAGRIENGPFYVEMAVCADPDEASPGSIRLGRSLHEARAGLSPEDAARLVEDLARAVQAAHRTGVVHGDLKPENVLLTPETQRVMLADFGLATSLAAIGDEPSTPVGTVTYMAPEQWRDRLPPSEASDVYGLGGTLYFLLSGAAPHAARARGEDLPIPPLPPEVPQRLREIVGRALAADARDRPPSAGALAEELRRFGAHEPTFHDLRRPGRRLVLFARRHVRELVAIAAVLALLLPAGLAGYRALVGQLAELGTREATLRARIEALETARLDLERDTSRLEGEASAKQQELARVEGRLKLLPKMDQSLGAARAQAEASEAEVRKRDADLKLAQDRLAQLDLALASAREALAQGAAREALASREAGRAAGEAGELRARLAAAEAEAAAARRDADERRAALEAELRDREAAVLAGRPRAGGEVHAVPAAGKAGTAGGATAARKPEGPAPKPMEVKRAVVPEAAK